MVEPAVETRIRSITSQLGFTIETGESMQGEPYIRLVEPPAGRGKARQKYTVLGPSLADVFRALADVL